MPGAHAQVVGQTRPTPGHWVCGGQARCRRWSGRASDAAQGQSVGSVVVVGMCGCMHLSEWGVYLQQFVCTGQQDSLYMLAKLEELLAAAAHLAGASCHAQLARAAAAGSGARLARVSVHALGLQRRHRGIAHSEFASSARTCFSVLFSTALARTVQAPATAGGQPGSRAPTEHASRDKQLGEQQRIETAHGPLCAGQQSSHASLARGHLADAARADRLARK